MDGICQMVAIFAIFVDEEAVFGSRKLTSHTSTSSSKSRLSRSFKAGAWAARTPQPAAKYSIA